MQTSIQLIGLNGGMGVGKSTAISALNNYIGREAQLVKFAGKLYEIQELAYKAIEEVYQRPPEFVKDRKLLQWLGTDWGRGLDKDIWVKIWICQANKALNAHCIVVSDDVRFDNEAQLIRDMGGKIIKITRPDNTAHAAGGVGIAGHKSEAGIAPSLIDALIENNGSLEEYEAQLVATYRQLGVAPNQFLSAG